MMTRKHFIALAEAIFEINDEKIRRDTAGLIGQVCSEFNDSFNWITWFKACGVDAGEPTTRTGAIQ